LSDFNFASKFKNRVYDFLVSLQGIDNVYDEIVGKKGAFNKQILALENLYKLNIPIRVNIVLTKEVLEDLEKVVEIALKYKSRVINFIYYNNTGDQYYLRNKYKIPFYELVANKLESIIDAIEEDKQEIEINIRFLPFCILKEKYRKYIQNSKQQIFDLHEWEKSQRFWLSRKGQKEAYTKLELPKNEGLSLIKFKLDQAMIDSAKLNLNFKDNFKYKSPYNYQLKIFDRIKDITPDTTKTTFYSKVEHFYFDKEESYNLNKVYSNKCQVCSVRNICDGIHKDYLENIGEDDVSPITLENNILDPLFYMKEQKKVVENREKDWFFEDINYCNSL